VIKAIRKFVEEKNYHELESPILSSSLPQERYLEILETNISLKNNKIKKAYLIPSTETFNKRILASGIGNHFVISKVFRGLEEIGPNHSPEFTMLEWYTLGSNYLKLMSEAEEIIIYITNYLNSKFEIRNSKFLKYQNLNIDFGKPWLRFSIEELLNKYLKICLKKINSLSQIKEFALSKGYKIYKNDDWQIIFEEIFANEIEPNLPLDKPYFLYDYPKIMCPLTKIKKENPLVCEKVELYIAGREIANGYTEQRDWKIQKLRFLEEQKARKKMGKKDVNFDNDIIEALESGIPEVAGIGLGIDRLAMILANVKTISEINYFPAEEEFSND